MRHGKAEEARFEGLDGDRARRLTAESKQRLRETLPGLRGLQVRPHRVLSSPYPRANQNSVYCCQGSTGFAGTGSLSSIGCRSSGRAPLGRVLATRVERRQKPDACGA